MNPKLTVFLLFATSCLVGCGANGSSSSSSLAVTPVYQGMEISKAPSVAQRHRPGAYGDEIDQENPFNNGPGSRIEDLIAAEMPIGTFTPLEYYAVTNEEVIVTVNILNPTGYEILSFTLNGYKYQSYQFEDGSDSETLLLKTNVGTVSGIKSYTIDQIKYVDGTEIKDVLIEGNQTVEIGIAYAGEPSVSVTSTELTQSSYRVNIQLIDPNTMLDDEGAEVRAFLFDGATLIQSDAVNQSTAVLVYEHLSGDTLYQYAIVGIYDEFDSVGPIYHYLQKEAFYTRSYIDLSDITPTQSSVTFALAENDPASVGEITSIKLLHGDTLIHSLTNLSDRSFSDLLSYNEYTIEVQFTYNLGDDVGQRVNTVKKNFTTTAKMVPTLSIGEINITQTSATFTLDISDTDDVGQLTALELWKSDTKVQTAASLTDRQFSGLLSNNDYTIKAIYAYDLNDGLGSHDLLAEKDFQTLAKSAPVVDIVDVVSTETSLSFDLDVTDYDDVYELTALTLNDETSVIESLTDLSLRSFSGLTRNTGYQIRATYRYDLNDGEGFQSETAVENTATLAQEVTVTGIDILNTTNPKVGEEVHVNIFFNNPDAIVITSFVINGQVIGVVGGVGPSSAIVRFVPEYDGGLYEVVIDSVQYLSHGVILTQAISSSYTDEILILGDIQILSISMLDGLNYISYEDAANEYIVVELLNPTSYDISGLKIVFAAGGSATTYSAGEITMIDSTHVKVHWKEFFSEYGIATIEVTSLTYGIPGYTYSNKLFSGQKASFRCVASDTVHLIHNPTELAAIETNYVYRLANDIDMLGVAWEPLPHFQGVFDGNDHVISNLALVLETTATENQDIGLFTMFSGNVFDLTFSNVYLSATTAGQATVGVLCGNFNLGIMENITVVNSNIYVDSPRSDVGALLGGGAGKMTRCSVINTYIHVESTLGAEVGGIAGQVSDYDASCEFSHNRAKSVHLYVSAYGSSVGGLVGFASLEISECFVSDSLIDVTSTATDLANGIPWVAGIVGSGRDVSDCFVSESDILADFAYDGYVAGIIAESWGTNTVDRCMVDRLTITAEMPGINPSNSSGRSQLGLISVASTLGAVSDCLALDCDIIIDTHSTTNNYNIAPNSGAIQNSFIYEDVSVTLNGGIWTNTDSLATLEQLNHATFYTTTLGWDPYVWNLVVLNYVGGIRPTLWLIS